MEETQNTTDVSSSSKPSNFPRMGIVAFVLVIALGFIIWKTGSAQKNEESLEREATMQDESNVAMSDDQTLPAVEGASSSASDEKGLTTIDMEAGSYYFKPNEIKVKKGAKVKVVITSKDMMHNFNIDELSVKSPLVKAGETSTVEFTADKVGTFEYYCSVGQHRQKGQIGKLIIEE